jgi:hypothetical protein
MLALTVLGLVGTAVLGIYAIYDQRRNRRVRRLVYDTFTVPLATAFRNDEGYKVSIQLERPGQDAQTFDAAYLTFVRFANFGREPIRKDDIAPASPLVLEAETDAPGEILAESDHRGVSDVVEAYRTAGHLGAAPSGGQPQQDRWAIGLSGRELRVARCRGHLLDAQSHRVT